MTRARLLLIGAYCVGYLVAVFFAVSAADERQAAYSVALFATSAGLLVAIRREYRHSARLIALVGVYRHHQVPAVADRAAAAAVERATALPPGCTCETWWTSLGHHHDRTCAALARKECP
ncbi:hypothetical protein AB0A05_07600 [Streptomyces sp. NPDC046374]|uniref:hypothetical protein n=1 Tax=Streptomyces sp. NPDC046374 TaxID=3154917 RepID=UPI0033F38A72